MPAYFDSGAFLRTPAWHRLGTVVEEWPGTWEETRKLCGLTWDVTTRNSMLSDWDGMALDEEAVYLLRDDMPAVIKNSQEKLVVNQKAKLGIHPTSYAIITNAQFGEVIESIVGQIGEEFCFETLISIKGGKQIIALMRSREPLRIPGDFSQTYTYLAFIVRHDGQGGLRAIPTNVRIVCANTAQAAEYFAKRAGVGVTIRHTANWESRIADLQAAVTLSVRAGKFWSQISAGLLGQKVTADQREEFLDHVLVLSSDMSERQQRSVERSRERVREIWTSPTCEPLGENAYHLLMGWTEYLDHERRANGDDSRVSRSLLAPDSSKSWAVKYVREKYLAAA